MGAGLDTTLRSLGIGYRHPDPPEAPERRPLCRNLPGEQHLLGNGLSLCTGSVRKALPHLGTGKPSGLLLAIDN